MDKDMHMLALQQAMLSLTQNCMTMQGVITQLQHTMTVMIDDNDSLKRQVNTLELQLTERIVQLEIKTEKC